MSIELQTAFEGDMAVIREDGTKDYVETDEQPVVIDAVAVDVVDVQEEKTESSNNDVQAALFGGR